jgi:NADH-quinone oxidoreductase subunit L
MVGPLVVLSVLSLCGGWVAAPAYWGGINHFWEFLAPTLEGDYLQHLNRVTRISPTTAALADSLGRDAVKIALGYAGIAVGAALIGFLVAWWFYIRRPKTPERLAESLSGPYKLLLNKYYVDEIYDALIVNPLKWISTKLLWHTVDDRVIDGAVNGVANEAGIAGDRVRRVQSGNPRSYAAWVIVGVVLFLIILLQAVR